VEDVEAPVEFDGVLRRARRAGFAPEHAEVVVSGLCRACATPGTVPPVAR
jgi:Fe2+ or Zn2+ uptake regulation protein